MRDDFIEALEGRWLLAGDPSPLELFDAVTYDAGVSGQNDSIVLGSGDLNADGRPDVIAAGVGFYQIYLAKADGTFQAGTAQTSGALGQVFSIVVADYNEDGHADAAMACYFGATMTLNILTGDGRGSLQQYSSRPILVTNSHEAADMNRDGHVDLVATAYDRSTKMDGVTVLLGNGDGTFASQQVPNLSPSLDDLDIADFDGDGWQDVAVADWHWGKQLLVLFGSAAGLESEPLKMPLTGITGNAGVELAAADFTGDGRTDIVAIESVYNHLVFFANAGARTFVPGVRTDLFPADSGRTLQWVYNLQSADLNADGNSDLVYGDSARMELCVRLGRGGGTFLPLQAWAVRSAPAVHLSIADFDLDGRVDVAAGGFTIWYSQYADAAATSVQLTASAATTLVGRTVRLTAMITAEQVPSTGTVMFRDGNTVLFDAVPVINGVATVDASWLTAGTHRITATYSGSRGWRASTSGAVEVAVLNAAVPTVSCSSATSVFGQEVTLTATVPQTTPMPTGTITFWANGTNLGTVPLDASGTASLRATLPTIGYFTLGASYSGDGFFPSNPSQTIAHRVWAETAVSLTSSHATAVVNTAVTFTASVTSSAGKPSGRMAFFDGTTLLQYMPLSSDGVATFRISTLRIGSHTIRAQYDWQGDWMFSASSPMTLVVTDVPGRVAVIPPQSPSNLGDPVTLTATVSPGDPMPTGTVTFKTGDTVLGSVLLGETGTALLTTSDLPLGIQRISAVYSGDSTYPSHTSAFVSHWVVRRSTLKLQSSAVRYAGQPITLTATVDVPGATGEIRFWESGYQIDTAWLDASGQATVSWPGLAPGEHYIAATYPGTDDILSSSSGLHIKVETLHAPLRIVVSPKASVWGKPVAVSAKFNGPKWMAPAGMVQLLDGKRVVRTTYWQEGRALFNVADLPVGQRMLSLHYLGDAYFPSTKSNAVTHTVMPVQTRVALQMPGEMPAGQAVRLAATVGVPFRSDADPVGTVTFRDGEVLLGTAKLRGGMAVFQTKRLPAGAHRITATYNGSASCGKSSASATQQILPISEVDLLVVYTPAAHQEMGVIPEPAIRAAVEETNRIFADSRIAVKMRLVRTEEIFYQESGNLSEDLDQVAGLRNDQFDSVAALRDQYGADLVCLFVGRGDDAAGIAFQLSRLDDRLNRYLGYSVVVAERAAWPSYTLAHELGHNFGAAHDVENARTPGLRPYSYGYRFNVGGQMYHDIMSYGPGTRVPYFANPRITYEGVLLGTASNNVARTINEAAPYVAAYRPRRMK